MAEAEVVRFGGMENSKPNDGVLGWSVASMGCEAVGVLRAAAGLLCVAAAAVDSLRNVSSCALILATLSCNDPKAVLGKELHFLEAEVHSLVSRRLSSEVNFRPCETSGVPAFTGVASLSSSLS